MELNKNAVNDAAVAELAKYLQDKFPKQKFHLDIPKAGAPFWNISIAAGGRRVVCFTKEGWHEGHGGIRYSIFFYPENVVGYGYEIRKQNSADITFVEMKKNLDLALKDSPKLVAAWRVKGLSDVELKELDAAYHTATVAFKRFFKGLDSAGYSGYGDCFTQTGYGTRCLTYQSNDENLDALTCSFYPKGKGLNTHQTTVLKIFRVSFPATTFRKLITMLNNLEPVLKKAVKAMKPEFAAMATGKLTEDTVIKGVGVVTASFQSCDEWLITDVDVAVTLTTMEPIPEELAVRWLKKNWHSVIAKAPDKAPVWEGESCSNCCHETPEHGMGWLIPRRMRFDELERVSFNRDRNDPKKGVISFGTSVR